MSRVDAFLGLDFGTSGARAVVIDSAGTELAARRHDFRGEVSAPLWRTALFELIGQIPFALRQGLRAIAVDGTSASVLLCGSDGEALGEVLPYDDGRATGEAASLAAQGQGTFGATSGLAKLFWLGSRPESGKAAHFLHQADWLAGQLHGQWGVSDYHNALKSGGDPLTLDYPGWLRRLPGAGLLPRILEPGAVVGTVSARIAHHFSLPRDCLVRAGTTDSIAAFLATGTSRPGEAVTSLGSTLVLKLLSDTRVESAAHGIYSHRLGGRWLAGGASNSGGAVLRRFFDDGSLAALSRRIDPSLPSGLDYYPLNRAGERFPVSDPLQQPRLEPRPADDAVFLHGLLEGIARIEAQGYRLLQELGATPLERVSSAGGGACNATFGAIRAAMLGVPLSLPEHTEAAYGAALLARDGTRLLYSGNDKQI